MFTVYFPAELTVTHYCCFIRFLFQVRTTISSNKDLEQSSLASIMSTYGTMFFINMLHFIFCVVFTCLCHLFPSTITRLNSQAFASQIGRHFGQQSHHFQHLIWHIYHRSTIDRVIHVITIVLDTLIWIFFVIYYLPICFQLLVLAILIFQALSAQIRFMTNDHGKISKTKIDQSICLDCDTYHEYPETIGHYISLFQLQWTWNHEYVGILSSFVWIALYCSGHMCLILVSYSSLSLPYILEIMHAIILINTFSRVIGHLLEPIPPFLIENEQFLPWRNIKMLTIMVCDRGEVFRLFQITFTGYLSEYQAGWPLRFPQVFIHTWISLLINSNDGKSIVRHCREQACRIRSKGWKATHLTENMFEALYH
ncbi:hypothetical protein I4U23_021826 [Adineta vaga]|nr:hypothetical protein I4U23_021826 [Adineta vaga]